MASRRANRLLVVSGLQVVLFWTSSYVPGLGAPLWHHLASLVVVLAIAIGFHRPLARSRRVLAIGVLAFTALAAISGFWLLYWKEGIRAAGYQDWGVFWHVAWSWAGAVFFFQHTWINRIAFVHFVRQRTSTISGAVIHWGAYVLVIVAFLVTWSDVGKDWFTVESYIPLSLYAWLVATAPAYAAWLWRQVSVHWLKRTTEAIRARGTVDVALVPFAALAVLSGVPLTFFDPFMDENGWKYASKYWHVWPSVAFTVLVFTHGMQTWHTMRTHWRNYGIAVGDVPRPASGMRAAEAAPARAEG